MNSTNSLLKTLLDKHSVNLERQSINLHLGRIKPFLEYLGNPQKRFKSVLIGGTNGKGSVTFYLSNLACKLTNHKIGRFISPHLVDLNERYVINESQINDDSLYLYFSEVLEKLKEFEDLNDIKLTPFEIYTSVAFYLFAKEKIDVAFLEVGLGGRLDAVNAVDSEDVLASVITSVSFDHMHFLGDTIEKIAYEKAGIIKENNKIITAISGLALDVISRCAKDKQADLVVVKNKDSFYIDQNINLALKAWETISTKLSLPVEKLNKREFLERLQFPGRFQYFERENILIDGAHNVAAAYELRKLLDSKFKNKNLVYIIGMLNKDFEGFIKALLPENSTVICTEPTSHQVTTKERLKSAVQKYSLNVHIQDSLQDSINLVKGMKHDLIVITGSLYLVGEGLQLLKEEKKCLLKHH